MTTVAVYYIYYKTGHCGVMLIMSDITIVLIVCLENISEYG